MKKTTWFILWICTTALILGGCQAKKPDAAKAADSSTSLSVGKVDSDSADKEEQDAKTQEEQEDGAAAEAADEISSKHQEEPISESVPRADIEGAFIQIPQAGDWIRKESQSGEDGQLREVYLCDEDAEVSWERSKIESEDVQEGLTTWLGAQGWVEMSRQKQEILSETLGTEVYYYEASGEDEGYSMMHTGVYFLHQEYRYIVDFSVIEGSLMEYYDSFQTWLDDVTLSNQES